MEALNMVMPLGGLGSLINKLFIAPILITLAYFTGYYFLRALGAIWRRL